MSSGERIDPAALEYTPSADFQVGEGPRDIGLCFVGDGFVAGYGDPKALGWVSRVVGRTDRAGTGAGRVSGPPTNDQAGNPGRC